MDGVLGDVCRHCAIRDFQNVTICYNLDKPRGINTGFRLSFEINHS